MAGITQGANVSPVRSQKDRVCVSVRACVCVLAREREAKRLVGGSRMKNHHQSKCRYCGSLTPWPVSPSIRHCPPARLSLSGPALPTT